MHCMYGRLILIFLLLVPLSFIGQVTFQRTSFDLGVLSAYSQKFVEIEVMNKTAKNQYILSIEKPYDVNYSYSSDLIMKDSAEYLRIEVNPKKKGKFSYQVTIYTSDRSTPTLITIKGILQELPQGATNTLTACPDFKQRPAGYYSGSFTTKIIVLDKTTKKELPTASIQLISQGKIQQHAGSNFNIKSTIGWMYVEAISPGYERAEKGVFLSPDRNQILIEMNPIQIEQSLVTEIDSVNLENLIQESPHKENDTSSNFSDANYEKANIVFVIDISQSMSQGDKMELMKFAMNRLTEMLRPCDQVALVTYATESYVLCETTSGDQKEILDQAILALKPSGLTAGGKGIKLGYKTAAKSKLDPGKNIVLILTDGAFNSKTDEDYMKCVRKYSKQNIQIGIVAIKPSVNDEKKLLLAAESGKGHYIKINSINAASKELNNLIRLLCKKKV